MHKTFPHQVPRNDSAFAGAAVAESCRATDVSRRVKPVVSIKLAGVLFRFRMSVIEPVDSGLISYHDALLSKLQHVYFYTTRGRLSLGAREVLLPQEEKKKLPIADCGPERRINSVQI